MNAIDVLTVLLLSIRLGAVMAFAPPLGGGLVPIPIRIAIVFALALALAPLAPAQATASDAWPSLGNLVLAAAREAALGMTMGLGLNVAVAIYTTAGRLLDIQIGFGMGQVFDPMTRQHMPVLTAVFNQAALVAFFLLDGHHALVRGFAYALELAPPGAAWSPDAALVPVIALMAKLFSLGLAMVAPVVFCLMLVELGLGLLARNLPQMNTLVVGMPIKVGVGLLALSAWAAVGGGAMTRAYDAAFAMWGALWK